MVFNSSKRNERRRRPTPPPPSPPPTPSPPPSPPPSSLVSRQPRTNTRANNNARAMATSSNVKSPLHNFSLSDLKWGSNQTKHKRLRKLGDKLTIREAHSSSANRTENPVRAAPEIRKPEKNKVIDAGPPRKVDLSEKNPLFVKTWNLRPRKPAPKGVNGNSGSVPKGLTGNGGRAPMGVRDEAQDRKARGSSRPEFVRSRSGADAKMAAEAKEKEQGFSISLSKEEIDEDIFLMTGSKPSRRPKKRSKAMQKQLDNVFPGLWLSSISPDSYKG
ncbi:splicing factor 3B subunit 2 [Carica papaya]|uniref:splicing factor 3B subunit 2 n=1 Tax=Carica papaya TaxID=3649 RepID=UPI000B8CFDF5|nr:splicing factor 3B subunit 2 [Carica papaya]